MGTMILKWLLSVFVCLSHHGATNNYSNPRTGAHICFGSAEKFSGSATSRMKFVFLERWQNQGDAGKMTNTVCLIPRGKKRSANAKADIIKIGSEFELKHQYT